MKLIGNRFHCYIPIIIHVQIKKQNIKRHNCKNAKSRPFCFDLRRPYWHILIYISFRFKLEMSSSDKSGERQSVKKCFSFMYVIYYWGWRSLIGTWSDDVMPTCWILQGFHRMLHVFVRTFDIQFCSDIDDILTIYHRDNVNKLI